MNVKELIEKLQHCDQNAQVYVYCMEDFNRCQSVVPKENNQGENELYCKGYSFGELQEDAPDLNYVVIADTK